MNIEKIILFTYGDATNASTWSNVPYLLTKSLEEKGFEITHVNLASEPKIKLFWNKYIGTFLSFFYKDQQCYYEVSFLNQLINNRKIKKNVNKNKDACFNIFLGYDFYNKWTNVPSLLLCDWSYNIYIKERMKRQPYFFEKYYFNKNSEAIRNADIVVSLFQDYASKMETEHRRKIECYGKNVVNNLSLEIFEEEEILNEKSQSNSLLFIGKIYYREGADRLIRIFKKLKTKYPNLTLDIIGFTKEEYGEEVEGVNFLGYLRKEVEEENILYYRSLKNAKLLVNPSELWAAYSSTVEAMYFYTPVLLPRIQQFIKEFGDNISNGEYIDNFSDENMIKQIEEIIFSDYYRQKCKKSHELVEDYTWDNYTNWLTKLMQKK